MSEETDKIAAAFTKLKITVAKEYVTNTPEGPLTRQVRQLVIGETLYTLTTGENNIIKDRISVINRDGPRLVTQDDILQIKALAHKKVPDIKPAETKPPEAELPKPRKKPWWHF